MERSAKCYFNDRDRMWGEYRGAKHQWGDNSGGTSVGIQPAVFNLGHINVDIGFVKHILHVPTAIQLCKSSCSISQTLAQTLTQIVADQQVVRKR